MRNLSFIFLTIVMLLGVTNSFASGIITSSGVFVSDPIDPFNQPGEKIKLLSNEEFFSKADYIIEVKPAGWEFTTMYDAGGNYNPDEIYTSTFMIVTRVYKNDEIMRISPGDTLNYIRKGGWIFKEDPEWGTEQIWSRQPVDYDTGEIGGAGIEDAILFIKKSNLLENPDTNKRGKYSKVSMLQDLKSATIKIGGEYYTGEISGLNDLQFNNRYELYKYMEQFEGVTVPLSNPHHMRWYLGTGDVFDQYLKERNVKWLDFNDPQVRDSLNRVLEMQVQKAREKREKKREQGQLRSQTNNILTVTIQNQAVLYDKTKGKYYFHFDVYVAANNYLTYLHNVILRLSYNTTAFGTNIKANNKVEVDNYAEFDAFTYNSSSVYDVTSNTLNLGIGVGTPVFPVRTLLTTTSVKLLKVKIELLNGLTGTSSGINFTDVANTSIFSMFTPSSTTPWYDVEVYDATNYNNPPGFPIYTVAPTLSNFTPTTTRAGVGDILTINGNNFGTQKGEVLFTKGGIASGATDYLDGLDESYIDSWTNTQIKVRVPSYVRKGYINQRGAGTGKIKVRTARNDESAASASSLNVEYSVTNASSSTVPNVAPICRVYLARLSNCNDIVFTLHQTFQGSSRASARNAVEIALQKWSGLLGIKLVLERNSSNTDYEYAPNFNGNVKNVIGFSAVDANGNNFSGMSTITSRMLQGNAVSNLCASYTPYRTNGSHIYIKDNPQFPWAYQTSGTVYQNTISFYEGILHEIGHVLNIEHVNNLGDLMYYGQEVSQNRTITDLISTSKPVVGAGTTVATSKNIGWTYPISIGTLGTLGGSCGSTGFYDEVIIQDPEPGRSWFFGGNLPPNTYIITPCSTANFHAKFMTGSTPATYPVKFDWLMVLYRSDGTEYVYYAQQNGLTPNTYNLNPSGYNDGCLWQPAIGSLPAYDWLYDSSGNIYGKVKVTVHINDGDIKSDITDIGVSPVKNIHNVIYSSNTTVNACSDINLKNIQIQGTPTVTFNMNGHNITIENTFEMPAGAAFTVNP